MSKLWWSAGDIVAHLEGTEDSSNSRISEKGMAGRKIGRMRKLESSELDDWVLRGGAVSSFCDWAEG